MDGVRYPHNEIFQVFLVSGLFHLISLSHGINRSKVWRLISR